MRWLAILFCCLIFPCRSALALEPAPKPKINDIYVVLMVIDGCRPDVLHEMIDRGELPSVKRHLVDAGTVYDDAITIFPSATTMGYPAMISGLYPGHMGLPYLEWLEREPLKIHRFLTVRGHIDHNRSFVNYFDPAQATLYEDLTGHPTSAIYTQFYRNASERIPHLPLSAFWASFAGHRTEMLDVYAYRDLLKTFRRPPEQLPRFTVAAFLGIDSISHKHGIRHPRINRNLLQFDAFLEEFITLLTERNILDRTYLILTSDHGMHDISGIFDLEGFLKSHGLYRLDSSPRHRANIFMGLRGLSSATMTVKHPDGWQTPIPYKTLRNYPVAPDRTLDIVDLIATAPEIELLLVRHAPGQVRVFRGRDEGMLIHHRRKGRSTYSYRAGRGDPLQLRQYRKLRGLLAGRALTAKEWTRRLAKTHVPGAVPNLAQIFDDGRAGDLFVVAKPDWGFFHMKKATHGSHTAADMRIPLLIRGPDVPTSHRGAAQIVDLYPTMLGWFGLPIPRDLIDGTPLF